MKKTLQIAFLLLVFVTVGAVRASAQNMSGSVKTVAVKFAPGKSEATLRGTASYAMSYVYTFKVKKGQTITIKADSKEPELTFSVFSPKPAEEQVSDQTKDWSGTATATGTYSITLVMNNEKAKRVPYSLLVKIQ